MNWTARDTSKVPRLSDGDYEIGEVGDRVCVELMYPRVESKIITKVEVGMCCVRSAQSITISYCHERDAWVISRRVSLGSRLAKEQRPGITSFVQEEEEIELALIPSWTMDDEAAEKRLISDNYS